MTDDTENVVREPLWEGQCPDCEEEDGCLQCADRVMIGLKPCGFMDAEVRRAFRRDGEDPLDLLYGKVVTADQSGLVGEDDIGGVSATRYHP